MTDEEKEEFLNRALPLMFERDREVIFKLNIISATSIISQLQLAFRHPENTGSSRQLVENLVRDWIEKLDPEHGDIYKLLMMGFEPDFDFLNK